MKRLYILRHAKSSWDDASLADFDRPLNDQGVNAAAFIGELIAGRGMEPEVIISSPAKRAERTAELVKENIGFDVPLTYDERVYEASLTTLLKVISEIPADVDSALLIGHNPGMEAIIRCLTGEIQPMSTAALASIKLAIGQWKAVDQGTGTLEFLIRPKEEMERAALVDGHR